MWPLVWVVILVVGLTMYIGSKEVYMRRNRRWLSTPVKKRSHVPPSIALAGLILVLTALMIDIVIILT